MKRILPVLLILTCSVAFGGDFPDGSAFIIRYAQDSAHSYILFRAADGYYWRWLVRNSNDGKVSEVRYTSVNALREELLRVDDYIAVMTNALWQVDSDDDEFSDMLEYLTDGDPYDGSIVPVASRTLFFDDGATSVEISPNPDMARSGGDPAGGSDISEVVSALRRIEDLLTYVLVLGSFLTGLVMWRLVILSKSQRNLF